MPSSGKVLPIMADVVEPSTSGGGGADGQDNNGDQADSTSSSTTQGKSSESGEDVDFELTNEVTEDDEKTLDEEEALESGGETLHELDDLNKDADMPLEQLLAMYGYSRNEEEAESSEDVSEEEEEEGSMDVADNKSRSPSEQPEQSDIPVSDNSNSQPLPEDDTYQDDPMLSSSSTSCVRQVPSTDHHGGLIDDETMDTDQPSTHLLPTDEPVAATSNQGLVTDETTEREEPSQTSKLLRNNSDISDSDDDADYIPDEDWRKDIRIGIDYQADIPGLILKPPSNLVIDDNPEDRLIWDPGQISEKEVVEYLDQEQKINRALTETVSADNSDESSNEATDVRDNEQALYLLQESSHSVNEALQRKKLKPLMPQQDIPLWSEEECKTFEIGLRQYGKDFFSIQRYKLKTKTVGELVKFYYYWKKTERHDVFASQNRLEKRKYTLHPSITDYMERFVMETDIQHNMGSSSTHPHHAANYSGNTNDTSAWSPSKHYHQHASHYLNPHPHPHGHISMMGNYNMYHNSYKFTYKESSSGVAAANSTNEAVPVSHSAIAAVTEKNEGAGVSTEACDDPGLIGSTSVLGRESPPELAPQPFLVELVDSTSEAMPLLIREDSNGSSGAVRAVDMTSSESQFGVTSSEAEIRGLSRSPDLTGAAARGGRSAVTQSSTTGHYLHNTLTLDNGSTSVTNIVTDETSITTNAACSDQLVSQSTLTTSSSSRGQRLTPAPATAVADDGGATPGCKRRVAADARSSEPGAKKLKKSTEVERGQIGSSSDTPTPGRVGAKGVVDCSGVSSSTEHVFTPDHINLIENILSSPTVTTVQGSAVSSVYSTANNFSSPLHVARPSKLTSAAAAIGQSDDDDGGSGESSSSRNVASTSKSSECNGPPGRRGDSGSVVSPGKSSSGAAADENNGALVPSSSSSSSRVTLTALSSQRTSSDAEPCNSVGSSGQSDPTPGTPATATQPSQNGSSLFEPTISSSE